MATSPVFEPLNQYIEFSQLHCLNEAEAHKAKEFLQQQGQTENNLESDCDEQLLLIIPFLKPVRINAIMIGGPDDFAPSHAKLFINKLNWDFSDAESSPAVQELNLSKEDTKNGKQIALKYVKFQNVNSLTIFVDKNHGNKDKTVISKLVIVGTEIKVEGTKMDPSAVPKNSRISSTDMVDSYH